MAFPDLIEKVRSGVVRIEVEACNFRGFGTGIIVAPRLIATVEHVVDGASAIRVKRGGQLLSQATVIGADPARDLALLRTKERLSGYRFRFAERAPRLGESVAALGFPFGLPLTVTRGTVSGLDRVLPIEGVQRRKLLQTDTAVNPGSSGGPLISTDTGEVIGLIDVGSLVANGIGFAVSAQVARPLLDAWAVAPQPVSGPACPGLESETQTAAAGRGVGVPSRYLGLFTSVDRLQRCNATPAYVYCSSGPSGRAVKLVVGRGVIDYGVRGSEDRGGPSMPMGTSFQTPNGKIECDSSRRGITCRDLTTGAYFIIGDYSLIVSSGGGSPSGAVGVPSRYTGYFTSVDRLQHCFASDAYVRCGSGPSGQVVDLRAGVGARYLGFLGSSDQGGPSMPLGTSFRTPSGAIECGSSTRGITCTDLAGSGETFAIGDRYVRVNGVRIAG